MSKQVQVFPGASMTENGMLYNGAVFNPVIDKCSGCNRSSQFEGQNFCSSYPMPEAKWSMGNCNFATHIKVDVKKVKVNPLKASKRAAKGGR